MTVTVTATGTPGRADRGGRRASGYVCNSPRRGNSFMRGTGLDSGPTRFPELVRAAARCDPLCTLPGPSRPGVGDLLRFELALPRFFNAALFRAPRTLDDTLWTLLLPLLRCRVVICEAPRTLPLRGSFRRMRRPSFHES